MTVPDAVDLLHKLAVARGDLSLAEFLQTPDGQARVQALHHLAGGNHRDYIILAEFIDREALDQLIRAFEKQLDVMTPFYQEQLRSLSPQQRKIIEFLCGSIRPTPVKTIARQLFISEQTVGGQLKSLRDMGYVSSHSRGRESLYELTEPLMRLGQQIRENQSRPLSVIVDFLRIWFQPNESADVEFQQAESLLRLGKWKSGFAALQEFLQRLPSNRSHLADPAPLLDLILRSDATEVEWRGRSDQLFQIYRRFNLMGLFGNGLVRSLARLSDHHLSPARLGEWLDLWIDLAAEQPEMELPLRLFDVGIRYLQSREKEVLFDLVETERTLLESALGLEPAPPCR